MRNLARVDDCDVYIRAELLLADITAVAVGRTTCEVPYSVIGRHRGWTFTRAWYYWVCRADPGKALPSKSAKTLSDRYHKEIWIDGHCGCPEFDETQHGPAVGLYHVDTVEGLRALAYWLTKESP